MEIIDQIFEKTPQQWSLRGDPHLWILLQEKFIAIDYELSPDEFSESLDNLFIEIIEKGQKKSDDLVWFENFPQHGMSGGCISISWWKETGLPLLKGRYCDICMRM